MSDRGLIEYRRLEGIAPDQVPAVVADADVVLDQFVLGLYSAMAVQGMFAGRLVVAHVADRVRARVPGELPVLEARPDDVVAVLERVLDDRATHQAMARDGLAYARGCTTGPRRAPCWPRSLGDRRAERVPGPGGTMGDPHDRPSASLGGSCMTGTVPIARPMIGEEERAAVDRVLASGMIASGPEVAAFEAEFAELVGGRHCVAVNSGTSALHMGLLARGSAPATRSSSRRSPSRRPPTRSRSPGRRRCSSTSSRTTSGSTRPPSKRR